MPKRNLLKRTMPKHRLIYPVLLLTLMVMMFCFSAQPAVESDETSGHFTTLAAHTLLSNLEEFDTDTQTRIISGFAFIVRKTAHFCEYALMGFLWYLWLREKKGAPFLALGASALYAGSDELHQYFVPGRSCELRDVLVDSCGAAAGILFAFVLLCTLYCMFHKGIVKWGTWKKRRK